MRRTITILALVAALVVPTQVATAAEGPPLRVPDDQLAAAVDCTGDLSDAAHEPILLLPGTTLTPQQFTWNYVPALRAHGWPLCAVTLPEHGMADAQVAAEYVVHAIRTVSAHAARKVDIVGHSQGGMLPRWALKYWPDTRDMVDDLVGLAPSNHGTLVANAICAPGCAPSFFQQRQQSGFMRALNGVAGADDAETWAGIDYTTVYTAFDEVVTPNFDDNGSSALHTGEGTISNVGVQEVCPGRVADHLTLGTTDAVGYALAIDALTHDGPVDPARIDVPGVCGQAVMPYVDPVTLPANAAQLAQTVATQVALYPHVAFEPPPADYVRARTPAAAGAV